MVIRMLINWLVSLIMVRWLICRWCVVVLMWVGKNLLISIEVVVVGNIYVKVGVL